VRIEPPRFVSGGCFAAISWAPPQAGVAECALSPRLGLPLRQVLLSACWAPMLRLWRVLLGRMLCRRLLLVGALPPWLHFLCWLPSVVGSLLSMSSRIGAGGRSPLRLSFLSVCCMCLGHFLCGFVSDVLCKPFFRHPFFLMKRHVKSCSRKKKQPRYSMKKIQNHKYIKKRMNWP
jgi:hypothetical protein